MARKPAAAKAAKSASLPNAPQFSKEDELKAYRDMLLVRRFEEKAGQMYGMGLIGGFCHLYIGQEAVVTGITMASRKGDAQITGYRDHGHMLVMGLDPKQLDPDILTERARALLSMAQIGDMVVMVDPATGKPISGSIMSSTENQSMPKIEVGID